MLQSVISIFVYDIKLQSIRKKFKWETLNQLQDAQLALVKVAKVLEQKPNPQFKRLDGREFQFLGEMYDIVRKKEYSDTTYYYCFHDSDESEIVRGINRWMHDNFGDSKKSNDKSKAVKDAFKQPYLPAVSWSPNLPITSKSFYTYISEQYYSVFLVCATPPPDFTG